jgi:hypothetical protein
MAAMFRLVLGLLCVALLGGCSKKTSSEPPPPHVEMTPNAEMKWNKLCATCHGPRGKGDGPAGRNLKPTPRDFSDPGFQDGISDADIRAIIVHGGAAVKKSKDMPPSPELAGQDEDLESLVKKVRSFRR